MRVIPSLLRCPAARSALALWRRSLVDAGGQEARHARRWPKIGTRVFSRNERLRAREKNFSDFVVADPSGLAAILRLVNLEVGEERRRLLPEHAEHVDRHAPDLQLGPLA